MKALEIVPYLIADDAKKAIEFYSQIFNTKPWVQLNMPDGRIMHLEFRIGNTRMYLSDEIPEHGGTPSPKTLGGTTVSIHLYVTDCDEVVKLMVDNGSELLMEPTDMFFGERFSRVRDPFGHEWGISTILKEMSPDEIEKAASQLFESTEQ